jgi:hypothetical protein
MTERGGRSARSTGLILSVVLLVAGCAESERSPPGGEFTERVENGVVIAENGPLDAAPALEWEIDTTNAVRIGVMDGPEEYVIGRLAGILLRPDGSILIADGLARDLRLFDSEGNFVRRTGGPGEGPGEYASIDGLVLLGGDSVAVLSGFQVNILDPELRYIRRFNTRLAETQATPPFSSDILLDLTPDGQPVMADYLRRCDTGIGEVCADSVAFFVTNADGETVAGFGQFPYNRTVSHEVRPGLSTSFGEPHPQPMWTFHEGRLYFADARRFEVRIHGEDGAIRRVIRVPGAAPRYPLDRVFAPITSETGAGHPEADALRRVMREARTEAALPDSFPHFSDLLVSDDGHVWVREYLPPGVTDEGEVPRWFVFSPEGRLLGQLPSPEGLRRAFSPRGPLVTPRIGTDYILGFERDDLGVESVVLYPLRR